MALIDADGLFGGDRFELMSDEARLYWPYFWCATNTVGRIELNYRKVLSRAFSRFRKPPSEDKFWGLVGEFQSAYLLFVYEHEGQMWGAWDTTEKLLPRHKLAADQRSPAPMADVFLDWKKEYADSKKAKSIGSTNFGNFAKVRDKLRIKVRGIGVGVGVGGGIGVDTDAAQALPPTETPQPPEKAQSAEPAIPIETGRATRLKIKELPQEWLEWAMLDRKWDEIRTRVVWERFKDFWIAKSGRDATKLDWRATWRNWCRNERDPPARGSPVFPAFEGATERAIRVAEERIQRGERL